MIQVHVWYEFSSSSSLLLRLRRALSTVFLGCDDYEFYLAGLLHWPQDRVTVQVSLCFFGVNKVKWKEKKIRYYIVIERAQGPTLLDCNYADNGFTVALGSVLAGCYTQVPHRSTLYRQVTSTRVTRGPQVFLSTSSCSFLSPKMAGKSTDFSRTHRSRRTQI